jgi:hypothetical protein
LNGPDHSTEKNFHIIGSVALEDKPVAMKVGKQLREADAKTQTMGAL